MSEYPLVEPEGVNAGSAEELDEDDAPAAADDTRAGGEPARAPDGPEDEMPDGSGMVGTPSPQEESGQDAGSSR